MAPSPPARALLETPPLDFEEPEADRDFAGQHNASAARHLPSPRDEPGLSPSSSSIFSSNVVTIAGRCRASGSLARSGAARSGEMVGATTAAAHTSACWRNTSPVTANAPADSQYQFATTHADHNAGGASPASTEIYRTNREHGVEAIDPDLLPTAMALDDEMPNAQARNGIASPHGTQSQHRPEPSASLEQHPAPFFSPMPDVDLDLAGFTFSPLPGHMMDLGHHQHSPQLPNDLSLQPHHIGDFGTMYAPSRPLARAPSDHGATRSDNMPPDAPRSSDRCDMPLLLKDERRPRPVLTVDDATLLSVRNDLKLRLGVSNHEIDIPQAKTCQAFLSSYIANFHGHLPIIHLPTLCSRTPPSSLFLAMCSIGALYRLDRRRARQLYDTASRSVEVVRARELPNLVPFKPCPLGDED